MQRTKTLFSNVHKLTFSSLKNGNMDINKLLLKGNSLQVLLLKVYYESASQTIKGWNSTI